MKNFNIFGSFLMGLFIIGRNFEANRNTKNILFLVFGLAFALLAYEYSMHSTHSKTHKHSTSSELFKGYSIAHGLIFLLFILNTFWYPILEENKLLSIAILLYNLFLIKEPSKLNIFGFIIALLVYLYEGYNLINEKEKPFINILKIIACAALVIYYTTKIFHKVYKKKYIKKNN